MLNDPQTLTTLALNLTTDISNQDRFEKLLATIRQIFDCDAAVLLKLHGKQFIPLATDGLKEDVLGRRFVINEHPRLEAIARAGDIVRFPSDSTIPDPYDGLVLSHQHQLKVHACVGLPLLFNQRLIGAVTIDSFNPEQFDKFNDDEMRTVMALASVSLNNALMIEILEKEAGHTPSFQATESIQEKYEIIGQSKNIQDLNVQIEAVASSDLSVLVMGETGVGKELVAAQIHQQSTRSDKDLVHLNCAALPESVAESELFGHVKGAFTGAISDRKGKFETADKGTLFLDEVGELPLSLQAKLLRVLQYGDVQRVGDDKHLKVNTRIIAATNRDLNQEVVEGRFRADLYHRLSVFPIVVPPLRDRGNDLILLAGFFLERCRAKLDVNQLVLTDSVKALLSSYHWPGNVRELEHIIYRAAVIARSESTSEQVIILAKHINLPIDVHKHVANGQAATDIQMNIDTSNSLGLKAATDEFQRNMVRKTLDNNKGNWAKTARDLGLDVGNLHRLAKRLQLK